VVSGAFTVSFMVIGLEIALEEEPTLSSSGLLSPACNH